jgi:hypothetical protein
MRAMTISQRADDLPADRKCLTCGITYETRQRNLKFRAICAQCAKFEAEELTLQEYLNGDLVIPAEAVA